MWLILFCYFVLFSCLHAPNSREVCLKLPVCIIRRGSGTNHDYDDDDDDGDEDYNGDGDDDDDVGSDDNHCRHHPYHDCYHYHQCYYDHHYDDCTTCGKEFSVNNGNKRHRKNTLADRTIAWWWGGLRWWRWWWWGLRWWWRWWKSWQLQLQEASGCIVIVMMNFSKMTNKMANMFTNEMTNSMGNKMTNEKNIDDKYG